MPVGVAIAGLCSFVVGAFWFGLAYQRILSNQDLQAQTLERLERKLDSVVVQFVTRERFELFMELLKQNNPNITVPMVNR